MHSNRAFGTIIVKIKPVIKLPIPTTNEIRPEKVTLISDIYIRFIILQILVLIMFLILIVELLFYFHVLLKD